jgi:cobalt-zinc-cadmium efflux system protein
LHAHAAHAAHAPHTAHAALAHGLAHEGHHRHAHGAARTPARKLSLALALTASFMLVEAVAGWLSGSLALLADAGHMLSDTAALALALFAQRIASRPRSQQHTFGSRRAEVLAAFVNGIALAVAAALIVHEALGRLVRPTAIAGPYMLATAVAGLLVNAAAAAVLGSGTAHNANTRAAYLHVLSDAAGSVGAIAAAVLVLAFGWTRADPVVSLLIAALVLWGAWRLVRETTAVLMEASPAHVDVVALEATIRTVPGVCEVHDLHAWTISEGFHAVTAHVVLNGARHGTDVVADAARAIRLEHGIEHVTLQPEAPRPGLVQIRIRRPSRPHEGSR